MRVLAPSGTGRTPPLCSSAATLRRFPIRGPAARSARSRSRSVSAAPSASPGISTEKLRSTRVSSLDARKAVEPEILIERAVERGLDHATAPRVRLLQKLVHEIDEPGSRLAGIRGLRPRARVRPRPQASRGRAGGSLFSGDGHGDCGGPTSSRWCRCPSGSWGLYHAMMPSVSQRRPARDSRAGWGCEVLRAV